MTKQSAGENPGSFNTQQEEKKKMSIKNGIERINQEKIEEMASVEAAADSSVQSAESDLENLNDKLPYVIQLSRTYNLEGKEIREVDLSGLEDLTTKDGEHIDRVMSKMGYHPKDKFRDLTYTKHIAMRVTNLPIEFVTALRWKDLQAISSRISIYFLF